MEVVTQVLIGLLTIGLFVVGLSDVVCALTGYDSPLQRIVRKGTKVIGEIAAEGGRTMDELSEQYLNEVHDQVTHLGRS